MAHDANETEFREAARRCISLHLSPRDVAFVAADQPSLFPPHGKVNCKFSSNSYFTLDMYITLMMLNDIITNRKPHAGTFERSSRKKWCEHFK